MSTYVNWFLGFRPFKGSSWSSGFALMAGLSSDDRSALLKALQLQLQLYDNGRIVEWKWDWSSPNIFYLTISPTLGLGLFYRCAEWRWLHSKATGVVEETGWSARSGPCSFPTASENQHQLIKYIALVNSFSVPVWTISFIFCGSLDDIFTNSGIWGSSIFLCDTVFAGWCYPGVWGLHLKSFEH